MSINSFLGKWLPLTISVIATLISLSTFYLVSLDSGKLKIFLSDRIGVTLNEKGKINLLVPFVLSNTGAPRTQQHLISAKILFEEVVPNKQTTELIWTEEYQFLNKYAYEVKYGKSPDVHTERNNNDSEFERIDYVNRALPFALWGGNSLSKIISFDGIQAAYTKNKGERLEMFRVKLMLKTEHEIYEVISTYRCIDTGGLNSSYYITCKDASLWR